MLEKIFYNGMIITMEDTSAEAVLIADDRIKKIGTMEEVKAEASEGVQMVDLKGNTMMPSFVDAHSHFIAYAFSFIEISLEEAQSFSEIIQKIKEFINNNGLNPNDWVIAAKYDHNNLKEKIHPTIEALDEASPDHPLVIKHQSGHMGVFNSKALDVLGVTVDTVAPEGGYIGVKDGKLTGYMEENAYMEYIKKVPFPSPDRILAALKKAQDSYLSYGITTVQEGYFIKEMIPLVQMLLHSQLLELDLVAYMDFPAEETITAQFGEHIKCYKDHFKIGGLKTFMDGSPQGMTAWMKTPYLTREKDYFGIQTQTMEEIKNKIKHAIEAGYQILCHCNGDAAIECYIDAYALAAKEAGDTARVKETRPVIIHAQLMTEEEIRRAKALDMIASYFVAHVYYWGDVHCKNFGIERAEKISPAMTALQDGLIFTFHQDTPVIEPNMLETVWCAVNRITKNGVTLGINEAISPYEALKAVTINSAYQYHEEMEKGTIKEGKFADLIILNENPMEVNSMRIKDIVILETIKSGKTVYCKNGNR